MKMSTRLVLVLFVRIVTGIPNFAKAPKEGNNLAHPLNASPPHHIPCDVDSTDRQWQSAAWELPVAVLSRVGRRTPAHEVQDATFGTGCKAKVNKKDN